MTLTKVSAFSSALEELPRTLENGDQEEINALFARIITSVKDRFSEDEEVYKSDRAKFIQEIKALQAQISDLTAKLSCEQNRREKYELERIRLNKLLQKAIEQEEKLIQEGVSLKDKVTKLEVKVENLQGFLNNQVTENRKTLTKLENAERTLGDQTNRIAALQGQFNAQVTENTRITTLLTTAERDIKTNAATINILATSIQTITTAKDKSLGEKDQEITRLRALLSSKETELDASKNTSYGLQKERDQFKQWFLEERSSLLNKGVEAAKNPAAWYIDTAKNLLNIK